MNKSVVLPTFEDMMSAATKEQYPLPDKEFVESVRVQIVHSTPSYPRRLLNFPINLQHPRRVIIGLILTTMILVTLIIGPQNVIATIQNLLGYFPGVGFAEAKMALVEPVTVEREGITVTVENLVVSDDGTTLIYRVTDRPIDDLSSYREEHKDDPNLNSPRSTKHYLQAVDGTMYTGHVFKAQVEQEGRANKRGNELVVYIEFPTLPSGTQQIEFSFDYLIEMYPGMAPENWEFTLELESTEETGQIPVYQPDYVTLTPAITSQPEGTAGSTLSDEVELILEAVSVHENVLTLSISVQWEDPHWTMVNVGKYVSNPQPTPGVPLYLHHLMLKDANGVEIPLVWNILESPGSGPEQKATYVFSADITALELVSPMTMTLNGLNVEALIPAGKQNPWSFEFSPTTAFQPGDCEPLNRDFIIYDTPIEFTEVCSMLNPGEISLGGGGGGGPSLPTPTPPPQFALALHIISPIGVGGVSVSSREANKECPDNCAGSGTRGNFLNEEHDWDQEVIDIYYQVPTWPIKYEITAIGFLLPGPWAIQFYLPEAQEESRETGSSAGIEAAHLSRETVPDGTTMIPGEEFIKTFTLENIGETVWAEDYQLVFYSASPEGETMGAAASMSLSVRVAPGESVEVSIPLTAPQAAGKYTVVWQLVNDRGEVILIDGGNIWVIIEV